ncbi:MAG: hypothetical protein ACI4EJ_03820 [Bacteroides sp.]
MKKKYMALNIIIPILAGALLYYMTAPDVEFVRALDAFLQIKKRMAPDMQDNCLITFVRNYVPDMLWAYALVFSVSYILGNNAADIWKTFLISAIFAAAMEMLQLTPFVKGTFDVFDMAAELAAQIFAVFIMNNMRKRGKSYEKI